MKKNNIIAIVTIIFVAALSRLIPHPNNVAPLGAMALFGGYYFTKKWQAFAVTASAWWLADLFLNNVIYKQYFPTFTWISQSFITVAIALIVIIFISKLVIKVVDFRSVLLASFLSSCAFFLITNFGTYLQLYPKNSAGLLAAYTAGIPFFRNTFLGDLVYSGILFGLYQLVANQLKMNKVTVK
jgi:hypothetical protein